MSGNCGAADNEESVTWTLVENAEPNTYTLTISGSGAMGDITYNWGDVDSAPWSQYRSRITKIEIGDGITYIGKYAFIKTAIHELDLSDCTSLVSIGERAFSNIGNGFTKVYLPGSLEEIGSAAFSAAGFTEVDLTNCKKLHTLNIESFSYCNKLKTAIIDQCDSLATIGNSCFTHCSQLADIALPSSIETVGSNAFSYTGLTRVDWSNLSKLKSIGGDALSHNGQLTVVSLSGCTSLESIGNYAFNGSSVAAVDITGCTSYAQIENNHDFDGVVDGGVVYSSEKLNLRYWKIINAVVNGGAFAKDADFNVGMLATPAKEGKVFAGWYDNDGFTGSPVTSFEAKKTYYAKWASEISFSENGGAGSMESQQVTEGDTSATLTKNTFTRTGYTFAGWNTSADGKGTEYEDGAAASNIASGTTLYAQWKANSYTISFSGGEGATGATSSVDATYDKPAMLTANGFSKPGSVFEGWDTDSSADEVVYSDATQVENLTAENGVTVTLYAVWGTKTVLNPSLKVQSVTYNGLDHAFSLSGEFDITYQQDGNTVTPKNAGAYDVVIHADETDGHAEYNATLYGGLVIEKAALTITPNNMSVYVGDAVPTLDQNAYKVEGLCGDDELVKAPTLSFESTPDMTKPGSVKIVAAGAEASDNYQVSYETGTLTVSSRPVTPPSSSDKTEVEQNQDGSTTTTVTKPDGSQTITHETATGTESVVTKDEGGNVTSTEVTVSRQDAEAGKVELPIEKSEPAAEADKAPAVEVKVPATVTADKPVQVTVPVSKEEGAEPNQGVVVYAVDAEGNETVLPKCSVDKDGNVVFEATGDVTIKVVDAAKDMPDVSDADWFAGDVVDFATARGIVNGVDTPSGKQFKGYDGTSRGMLVAMLHNLELNPEAASEGSPADVPEGAFYADAAAWALEEGILSGVDMPDGTKQFQGESAVTREQVAVFLMRYAEALGMDVSKRTEIDFPDAGEVSGFAGDAMSWAVAEGLFTGDDVTGELNPTDGAARAEVAAVLMRFINLMYA